MHHLEMWKYLWQSHNTHNRYYLPFAPHPKPHEHAYNFISVLVVIFSTSVSTSLVYMKSMNTERRWPGFLLFSANVSVIDVWNEPCATTLARPSGGNEVNNARNSEVGFSLLSGALQLSFWK